MITEELAQANRVLDKVITLVRELSKAMRLLLKTDVLCARCRQIVREEFKGVNWEAEQLTKEIARGKQTVHALSGQGADQPRP